MKQIQKKHYPKLERKNTKISLSISEKVQQQIKYLCEKIPNEEWSGVLFFETEGTIKEVKNLKLRAIDVVPLNIGTATFTNYQFKDYDITQKWIDLGVENNIRLGHRMLCP